MVTTRHSFPRIHPHYQTPGEEAGYNRSSVSDEDMGRLHPVAGREEEMLAAAHTLIKLGEWVFRGQGNQCGCREGM